MMSHSPTLEPSVETLPETLPPFIDTLIIPLILFLEETNRGEPSESIMVRRLNLLEAPGMFPMNLLRYQEQRSWLLLNVMAAQPEKIPALIRHVQNRWNRLATLYPQNPSLAPQKLLPMEDVRLYCANLFEQYVQLCRLRGGGAARDGARNDQTRSSFIKESGTKTGHTNKS